MPSTPEHGLARGSNLSYKVVDSRPVQSELPPPPDGAGTRLPPWRLAYRTTPEWLFESGMRDQYGYDVGKLSGEESDER